MEVKKNSVKKAFESVDNFNKEIKPVLHELKEKLKKSKDREDRMSSAMTCIMSLFNDFNLIEQVGMCHFILTQINSKCDTKVNLSEKLAQVFTEALNRRMNK